MKSGRFLPVLITFALLAGCAKEQPTPEAAAPPPEPATIEPATLAEGFSTPESVLYDPDQDVYFVSNINGSPLEADDNGYISRINAGTREIDAKWIDGEKDEITLGAPKGMAISGDTLWVTDITVVRKFDRRTGAPLGEVAIEGTTFLNDPSTGADGSIYVSDMGMKAGAEGFEPSETDAIYRISADGTVETIASGDELVRPNGLVATADGVWAVTFGGNELYMVVDGAKSNVVQLPAGSLDGLVLLEGGELLVSSWDSKSVYRGPAAGPFEVVITDVNAPADIGFDTKRNLVLIPMFMDNQVVLHPLD
jgi:sugar lactone lactonase YvrE